MIVLPLHERRRQTLVKFRGYRRIFDTVFDPVHKRFEFGSTTNAAGRKYDGDELMFGKRFQTDFRIKKNVLRRKLNYAYMFETTGNLSHRGELSAGRNQIASKHGRF